MKRSGRAKWLRSVGLTSGLVCQLAKLTQCECGEPAVAVGVFWNLNTKGEAVMNGMLLCAEHAGMADEDVEIFVMVERDGEDPPSAPVDQRRRDAEEHRRLVH